MSQVRIHIPHFQETLSFAADDLNQLDTARHVCWQLGQLLDQLVGDTPGVVNAEEFDVAVRLDLSEISWLGSVALNELINMNRMAKNHGLRFVLENVQESQREIFSLTRLERMFEFESSVAAVTDVEQVST